ncbi:MAG: acetolactate synthase small subunit [Ruminococcaceae bacterium]|nr:acetolactate synthase small subunit [Oscillospiraceae bacterium]
MKKQCMVLFVENNAGVLARVASLFVQRGFNIDSLTTSPTENEKISRLTIMTHGDERTFSQIMKQTGKLVETKLIFSVEPTFSLIHEVALVKFSAEEKDNEQLIELIGIYGARIVDKTGGYLVAELCDTPQRIDGFLEDVSRFKIIESGRSGAIAMERGGVDYEL